MRISIVEERSPWRPITTLAFVVTLLLFGQSAPAADDADELIGALPANRSVYARHGAEMIDNLLTGEVVGESEMPGEVANAGKG